MDKKGVTFESYFRDLKENIREYSEPEIEIIIKSMHRQNTFGVYDEQIKWLEDYLEMVKYP